MVTLSWPNLHISNKKKNEKLYNLDAIKNIKNGKIITERELVNTTKLGKVKVSFQVENFFKRRVKYIYS